MENHILIGLLNTSKLLAQSDMRVNEKSEGIYGLNSSINNQKKLRIKMNPKAYKFNYFILFLLFLSNITLLSNDIRNIIIESIDGKMTSYSAEKISNFQFQNIGDDFILNLNMKNKSNVLLFDVNAIDSIFFNSETDTVFIGYMNKKFGLMTDSIDYISFTQKVKELLFDSDITNKQDFTLDLQGKLKIKIPKGIIDENDHLTIIELNPALMQELNFQVYKQFEIVLKSKSIFDEPIEIEIPVKNAMLTDTTVNKIIPGYFDENINQWRCYVFSEYDTQKEVLKFQTKHLTKLGALSPRRLQGYTDFSSTLHFTIYWNEKSILSNTEYKSPFSYHNPNYPHYVQDLERYLEESYEAYKGIGLVVPTGKMDVYITDLGEGVGGEYGGFTGWIYIGSGVTDKTLIEPNALQNAAAHEYLHCVQDYYYLMISSLWWLEAMAANAERLVWGPNTMGYNYQTCSDEWKSYNAWENFTKSWYDCNYSPNPNFYIAGDFIGWLMQRVITNNNVRKGASLLSEVLVAGSYVGNSQVSSMLNSYLDTMKLGNGGYSSAIGYNYAKFLEEIHQRQPVDNPSEKTPCWQLNNPFWKTNKPSADGIIYLEFPTLPIITDSVLPGNYFNAKTVKITLPPLSGKVIHFYPRLATGEEHDPFMLSFVSNFGEEIYNDPNIASKVFVSNVTAYYDANYKRDVWVGGKYDIRENVFSWDTRWKQSEHLELLFVNTHIDNTVSVELIFSSQKSKY